MNLGAQGFRNTWLLFPIFCICYIYTQEEERKKIFWGLGRKKVTEHRIAIMLFFSIAIRRNTCAVSETETKH
jgi:hypothetical protein